MGICTKEDGYILDLFEFHPRWVVELSNREKVYQDDDRPGEEPKSAWIRLKQYVKDNSLTINWMKLQFRSNIKMVNDGPVDGFFFCKSCLGSPGMQTIQYFVAGTIKNGILETRRWQVPILEIEETEIRNIKDSDECIIMNAFQAGA